MRLDVKLCAAFELAPEAAAAVFDRPARYSFALAKLMGT
jgi:hypothetical protein